MIPTKLVRLVLGSIFATSLVASSVAIFAEPSTQPTQIPNDQSTIVTQQDENAQSDPDQIATAPSDQQDQAVTATTQDDLQSQSGAPTSDSTVSSQQDNNNDVVLNNGGTDNDQN